MRQQAAVGPAASNWKPIGCRIVLEADEIMPPDQVVADGDRRQRLEIDLEDIGERAQLVRPPRIDLDVAAALDRRAPDSAAP